MYSRFTISLSCTTLLLNAPLFIPGITGFVPKYHTGCPSTRSCIIVQKTVQAQDRRHKTHRRISSQGTDQDGTTSSVDKNEHGPTPGKNAPKNPKNNKALLAMKQKTSASLLHLTSKDLGSRRELYVVPQLILVLSIFMGEIPFCTDAVSILFGPVIFIMGTLVMGLAIKEMGGSFTAYPVPVPKEKGGDLIRSGIFSLIRHPIYAGNICCFIGLSIMTESSMRLLLTAFYYVYVEVKSQQEENEMAKIFGEKYESYKQQVESKFIPQKILNLFRPLLNTTSEKAWQ